MAFYCFKLIIKPTGSGLLTQLPFQFKIVVLEFYCLNMFYPSQALECKIVSQGCFAYLVYVTSD